MATNLDLARELYDAFAHADEQRLIALLHSDFRGHVSEVMPLGVGTHVSPTAMLREVWMPVAQHFAARPVPERFLTCDGVVDVIKLRDRQVFSLQMFHRDAVAVREFLDSTAMDYSRPLRSPSVGA